MPQPSIFGDTSFCEGSSTALSADQVYDSYVWSTGQDSQNITVANSGIVSLTVRDTQGCEGSTMVMLAVLPLPVISISGENVFCMGSTATLDAGAGFVDYLWSNNVSTQQLDVSVPGTYSVEVTDANGCTATASTSITENALPNVSITGDNAFCTGNMASLDAGVGFNTYVWSNGSINQTIDVFQSGTYSVEVTDTNSCSNTAQYIVIEHPLPQPQIAGSLSFCPGTVTTLDGGTDFVNYVWTGGITDQTLVVNTAGTYELSVIDTNGCEGSTSVEVSEDADLSPVIAGDLTFCVGTTTTLDAGAGFDTYTWSDNSTEQILVISQAGEYSVTVTNGGCSGEAAVSISEDALPIPTINGLSMICEDATTTINVNETFISYLWSDGTNNASIDVPPGVYGVQVEDINGCIGEATFDVSPISLPVPSLSGVTAICEGGATVISTLGNYVDFVWSTGSIAATTLVTNPGVLSVTVTDSEGCVGSNSVEISELENIEPSILGDLFFCEGESTIIEGEMGYASYEWSNGQMSQNLQVSQAGEYTLSVMDTTGCSGEITVSVIAYPLPQPIINGESGFCEGAEASVSVQDIFTAYTWSNGDIQASTTTNQGGVLSVLVTDANGCQNTATFDVTALSNPSPEITGELGFCPSNSTSLTTTENYDIYNWSTTESTASIIIDMAGPVSVEVTDGNGCIGNTTAIIEEYETNDPQIQGILDFCPGDSSTLTVVGTFETYQWSTNNSQSASIQVSEANTFGVTVSDSNGCETNANVTTSLFTVTPPQITGETAYCEGTSTILYGGIGYVTYSWSNSSDTQVVEIIEPGQYVLSVVDANGCSAETSIEITENPLPQADAGDIQTINCENDSVIIGGTTTSQGNYAYTWTGPGIDSSNQNDYQPTVDSGGVYTLVVEDLDNGCISESAQVEIEDLRYEPIVVLEVLDVLDCETLSVLINSDGSTYGSDITYQWQDVAGTIMSSDQNYIATQEGIVILMIIDEVTGCMALDSVTIEQNEDYPVVFAGDDQEIDCDTPDAILDGSASQSSPNIIYEWTAQSGGNIISDPTQPIITVDGVGSYTLVAIDTTNGCSNEDIVQVLGDFEPPIANAGMNQTLDCNNLSVLLEGNGSSIGTNISYQWQNASGETVGEDISFNTDMIGVYQLIVTDNQNGCTAEDQVEVFQVEDQLNVYDVIWDSPTCFGDDDASLSILNIEGGNGPYLYSINDGAFSSNANFTGLTAGNYSIVVLDANGCELFSEVVIEDGNDLQVNLGEDINIQLGEMVTIDGNVSVDKDDLEEIIWKVIGDSSACDDCLFFDVIPLLTSEYILTVVDSNGCIATDDLTIFVDARDDIFIPNAFSPNGDGDNERFTIFTGNDVAIVRSFLVFNRWGEIMFEVYDFPPNDEDFGWNGKYRGQLQNTGVFVYMAEIEFIDGTVELYKGDVLLMK